MWKIGENEYLQMAVTAIAMAVFICGLKIAGVIMEYFFNKFYPEDDE